MTSAGYGNTANPTQTLTLARTYSYDAFGNLLTPQGSGDTNRYLFSTKEFDSRSGLDYFGRRYYDPEVGRWLTQDPLGMVDGTNEFVYVHDNPTNEVDPLGLYGTDNCSYYAKQCSKYGGKYYCQDAPKYCRAFDNTPPFLGSSKNPNSTNDGYEGWQRCTRQCLQDCDAKHDNNSGSSTQQCGEHKDDGKGKDDGNGPNNNFWNPQNLMCHVECYSACTNPLTAPKGKDLPD